jgi:hypothetical protein
MTASLIRLADGLVGIEYGHFHVESRGLREPPRFTFSETDSLLSVTDDAFAVRIENEFTRYALVQLEAWDAEPEACGIDERVVRFTDPAIFARAVMAPGPETGLLDLGAPGTYRVRVHRWGSDEVTRVFRAHPDATIHRVEHVVLQLWRTTDQPEPHEKPMDELGEYRGQLDDWLGR